MTSEAPVGAPAGRAREALLRAARLELVEHGHAGISLRAVARRAGLSHAAPKHFFDDRAGLLTVVAAEGFRALARVLAAVRTSAPQRPLAAAGHAYIDFGLAHPALFDLMFRPSELHQDDPDLRRAQGEAIGELTTALGDAPAPVDLGPPDTGVGGGPPPASLLSWALAHGLLVLTRDGALRSAAGAPDAQAAARLARSLVDLFDTQLDHRTS